MSSKARDLFDTLRPQILELNANVLELAETKSVSYHTNSFFLEVLPRKHRLLLLLPLDFNEVDDPDGIAKDATEKKFLFYANYEGGVTINLKEEDQIEKAIPIINQALKLSSK